MKAATADAVCFVSTAATASVWSNAGEYLSTVVPVLFSWSASSPAPLQRSSTLSGDPREVAKRLHDAAFEPDPDEPQKKQLWQPHCKKNGDWRPARLHILLHRKSSNKLQQLQLRTRLQPNRN